MKRVGTAANGIVWSRQPTASNAGAANVTAPRPADGPGPLDEVSLPPRAPVPPAADVSFLAPAKLEGDTVRVFHTFVAQQLEAVPALKAISEDIGALLQGSRPDTLHELLSAARGLAFVRLKEAGLLDNAGPAKEHLITLAALVGLAGHSLLRPPGSPYESFPKFIDDGRSNSQPDKTWHVVNQALYSYVVLFDGRLGKGELAQAFLAAADRLDKNGEAAPIAAAYDRLEGKMVGMVPGTIAPIYEADAPYFPRPRDLDADEARAYDQSVRVGDHYEHYSTAVFPEWLGYDPSRLGERPELDDPTARVEYTLAVHSGLGDLAVMRDLTADRVGAWLGVQLFRNSAQLPQIPFDLGSKWSNRPLAAGPKGPFAAFYAVESALLARLAGKRGAEAGAELDDHLAWADREGIATATAELNQKISSQIDQLAGTDRQRLAGYYANFSVRQLAHQVKFGEGPCEAPDFATHFNWAKGCPVTDLKHELLRRVDLVSKAYQLRDLGAAMESRVLFSPGLGNLEGGPLPFLDGAVQTLRSPKYVCQRALLIADATGTECHVVKNGFLQTFESNAPPEFQGRYGYDVLGKPVTDEVPYGKGVIQRFEHGHLVWMPADEVQRLNLASEIQIVLE